MARKPKVLKIPEIDEKTIKNIYLMACKGSNIKEIAHYFDMSDMTLIKRMRANPKIREAYNKGKSKSIIDVSTKLFEKAMSDDPNALTAQIFFLKCKDPKNWNDRSFKQSENTSAKIPVPVFRLSDEAIREQKQKASGGRSSARTSRAKKK